VPDLAAITAGEVNGAGGKYALMKDVPTWTTNVGHPGCTNPAVGEIYDKGLVSKMFAAVATGRLTPDAALDEAVREERTIFERWRESKRL
jgi:multiple sugar transport system substrate-binding protein